MSTFLNQLNDLYSPAPVETDRGSMYMYDGDTIIGPDGESFRLPYFDAGEMSRIDEFGTFHAGSHMGPYHKKLINDIIREKNFNTLVPASRDTLINKAREKDKYDRSLMDLQNPEGELLSDYLHQERVIGANKWMSKDQLTMRLLGEQEDILKSVSSELSSGDKARAILDQISRGTFTEKPNMRPDFLRESLEDALKPEPNKRHNFFQSEINKLNAQLIKETDPEKIKELEEEIKANRDVLQYSANLNEDYVTANKARDWYAKEDKPGYWGETWNSAEKSLWMLENTAVGFSQWARDLAVPGEADTWGYDWALDNAERIRDAGYTTDFWSVRNPLDAMRFISNSIVQYAPQLGVVAASSAGGGLILGPPGMVAGALGSSFIMAVSQVYQAFSPEERDPLVAAGIAVPIAAFEALGLKGLTSVGSANILTKAGKEEIIEFMVQKKIKDLDPNLTSEQLTEQTAEIIIDANNLVNDSIRQILIETGAELGAQATAKLVAKKTIRDLAIEIGKRGGWEGGTEALQELTQDIGVTAWSPTQEFSYEDTALKMIESFAIGASVGGGITLPKTLSQLNDFNRALYEFTPESDSDRTEVSLWEENARNRPNKAITVDPANAGKKFTLEEVADEYHKVRAAKEFKEVDGKVTPLRKEKQPMSLQEMAGKFKNPGYVREFFNLFTGLDQAKRSVEAFKKVLKPYYVNAKGEINIHMQNLAASLDALRLYSGVSMPSLSQQLHNDLHLYAPGPRDYDQNVGLNKGEFYEQVNRPIEAGSPLEKVVQDLKILALTVAAKVKALEDKGIRIGISSDAITEDYFLKPRHFKQDIFKDRKFIDKLLKTRGYNPPPGAKGRVKFTEEKAQQIVSDIKNATLSPLDRLRLEEAGVFENNSGFKKYLSNKPAENVAESLNTFAKRISTAQRFGTRGNIAAEMIEKAYEAGEITAEDKGRIAFVVNNYLDMNQGNYKRIEDNRARYIQDNLLFFSAATFMDTNFWANMAEIGTGLIGLSPRQMWRSVSTSARMFSRATLAEMKSIGSKIPGTKITPKSRIDLVKSDDDFTRVAMTGVVTGSDAATLESTNTSTGAYKKATKLLYIVNQVEKQTASFRGGRGALAWDKIIDHILHVNNDFILGNVTQQGRYSRDMLNSYGLDVDFLVDYFNKLDNKSEQSLRSVEDRVRRLYGKEKEILQRYRTTPLSQFETMAKNEESDAAEVKLLQQYRIGVTNFTDELSVRPKKGDAPKLIEDPRFYLFTQYKRFAATFTANIMPTVWQNYIRRGPPGMTFATFSVIMGTYWLAMVSQLLKDLMVYGEKSPWLDEGEDPDWIDTEEFRAASYTGWLGTPGMAIEAIDRFNEKSMYTPILTNLGEAIVNQSPSLNAIYTNVKKGDENLQERVAKYTPFIGSIKPAREALANADLINFYKE